MTASPTLFLVCDDQDQRQQLTHAFSGLGDIRSFLGIESFLDFCRQVVPDGVVIDALSRHADSLRLFRGMRGLGIHRPVVQVVSDGESVVGLQPIDLSSVRLCGLWESGTVLGELLAQPKAQVHAKAEFGELRRRVARLTRREVEVMRRVVVGMMNKQIASELGLSPKTIEVHRAHVMEKMQAESLAELVRMAVKLEDVEVPKSADPNFVAA